MAPAICLRYPQSNQVLCEDTQAQSHKPSRSFPSSIYLARILTWLPSSTSIITIDSRWGSGCNVAAHEFFLDTIRCCRRPQRPSGTAAWYPQKNRAPVLCLNPASNFLYSFSSWEPAINHIKCKLLPGVCQVNDNKQASSWGLNSAHLDCFKLWFKMSLEASPGVQNA